MAFLAEYINFPIGYSIGGFFKTEHDADEFIIKQRDNGLLPQNVVGYYISYQNGGIIEYVNSRDEALFKIEGELFAGRDYRSISKKTTPNNILYVAELEFFIDGIRSHEDQYAWSDDRNHLVKLLEDEKNIFSDYSEINVTIYKINIGEDYSDKKAYIDRYSLV